jgi:hypothetical protein
MELAATVMEQCRRDRRTADLRTCCDRVCPAMKPLGLAAESGDQWATVAHRIGVDPPTRCSRPSTLSEGDLNPAHHHGVHRLSPFGGGEADECASR